MTSPRTTGAAPDGDPVLGPYPTVVRQASGRTVLVVQAFQYGKYLGMLNVTFDAAGEVADWAGNPVRLEGEKDAAAEMALQGYAEQVSRPSIWGTGLRSGAETVGGWCLG